MRFAGHEGRKAECDKEGVWECKDQSGAVADPPRSVWATGSWRCQSHIDTAFDQLCKPRPTPLPLFPGDGTQPPPGPLFQGAQHRRGFAEAEVTAPSNEVDGQLFDNLREVPAAGTARQLSDSRFEPGYRLRRKAPLGGCPA